MYVACESNLFQTSVASWSVFVSRCVARPSCKCDDMTSVWHPSRYWVFIWSMFHLPLFLSQFLYLLRDLRRTWSLLRHPRLVSPYPLCHWHISCVSHLLYSSFSLLCRGLRQEWDTHWLSWRLWSVYGDINGDPIFLYVHRVGSFRQYLLRTVGLRFNLGSWFPTEKLRRRFRRRRRLI